MALNLQTVDRSWHAQAKAGFLAGNTTAFLCSTDNDKALTLVFDNHQQLLDRGIFEQALLESYAGTMTNYDQRAAQALDYLFKVADRERLRAVSA